MKWKSIGSAAVRLKYFNFMFSDIYIRKHPFGGFPIRFPEYFWSGIIRILGRLSCCVEAPILTREPLRHIFVLPVKRLPAMNIPMDTASENIEEENEENNMAFLRSEEFDSAHRAIASIDTAGKIHNFLKIQRVLNMFAIKNEASSMAQAPHRTLANFLPAKKIFFCREK